MPEHPTVIFATLLAPTGPTGVHSHMREARTWLERVGLKTYLVTPYKETPSLIQKGWNVIIRLSAGIRPDLPIRLFRFQAARTMCRRLQLILDAFEDGNAVVYAQDAASALVADRVRRQRNLTDLRIVLITHFNHSEAAEHVAAGKTRIGEPLYRVLVSTEEEAINRVDQVVVPSEYQLTILSARHPGLGTRIPVTVIPNFVAEPTGGLSPEFPKVDLICIATLEPRKNQAYLLEVLATAKSRGYQFSLALVGDGPDQVTLQRLAQRLGVGDQVRFTGRVPNAGRLLTHARAYVHAARLENMPISLIEALAAGIPILAAPVGGIPEIVRDGCEGLWWNLDDPEDGATRLISLLSSPAHYAQASHESYHRYCTHFSPDAQGPRLISTLVQTARIV